MCNVLQYRWWCKSPWSWLLEIEHCSVKTVRPLLFFQNLLIASMHPHNSLPSYCSLLIQISVLKHLAGSVNEYKPLSQLQNHYGSLPGLICRFLAFFKGTLISNFNKMVNCELLIIMIQQLDDIYSITTSYLCTCLNIFGLGAYDVSAEQCKSRKLKVGNDMITKLTQWNKRCLTNATVAKLF